MKVFIVSLLVLFAPLFAWAQFTGLQDETVSPVYWQADDSYIGSSPDVTGSERVTITAESRIGSDGSLRSNASGRCSVAERTLAGYVDFIGCAVRVAIMPFIVALAMVSFVWGVTEMMRHPDNEESQKKGRVFILYGIIGFFVITSLYALVAIIRRTVGFGYNARDDATPYNSLRERVINLR